MTTPHKTPQACIQRYSGRAYCGRDIETKDFVFKDAARAITFYATSKVIEACPNCIVWALKDGVSLDEYLVPRTRGDADG